MRQRVPDAVEFAVFVAFFSHDLLGSWQVNAVISQRLSVRARQRGAGSSLRGDATRLCVSVRINKFACSHCTSFTMMILPNFDPLPKHKKSAGRTAIPAKRGSTRCQEHPQSLRRIDAPVCF
jgi:hypothetical protein